MRVKYEEDGSCNRDKCLEMHGKLFHDYAASLEGPEVGLGSAPYLALNTILSLMPGS